MKRSIFLYIIFIFISNALMLEATKDLSVSVIIPCHFKHARHLFKLIKAYENQTVLPNEIVISISESHKVLPNIINKLKSKNWKFPVTILQTTQRAYAGKNRNIACESAQSNIFATQDADDLPHPQRIEVIKFYFNNYDIDHIMHQYSRSEITTLYDINYIPFTFLNSFYQVYSRKNKKKVAWGNPVISANVFKKIQWKNAARGQDIQFNKDVCMNSYKSIFIPVPLFYYRKNFSVHSYIKNEDDFKETLQQVAEFIPNKLRK